MSKEHVQNAMNQHIILVYFRYCEILTEVYVNVCFPHDNLMLPNNNNRRKRTCQIRTHLIKSGIHYFLVKNCIQSSLSSNGFMKENSNERAGLQSYHRNLYCHANLCKGLGAYLDNSIYLFWKM